MATPVQMFEHRLNVIKGWWSMANLDKSLPVADGETGIKAGMVCYIDPDTTEFKRGLPGNQMPIFIFQDQDHYSALGGDAANISSYGYSTAKGIAGLPAVFGVELETAEYDTGESYPPNTPLTVINTAGDDQGKVTVGVFYTDTICAMVSDGVVTNGHGVSVVRAWTLFIPSTDAEESSVA